MAWKQDPIYSNLETDGTFTRPKINSFDAFMSGYTGGDTGKWTHRHGDWQMGKNCAPPTSTSTTLSIKPSKLKRSQANFSVQSKRVVSEEETDAILFSVQETAWFSLFFAIVVSVLMFLSGENIEQAVTGGVVLGACIFLCGLIVELLLKILWAARWVILTGVTAIVLLPLIN